MIEVGKPRIGNRISSFSLSFSSFVFCTNLQVEAKQHSVEFLLRHRLIAKYGRLYKIENNSGRRGIARGIVWTIAWRHCIARGITWNFLLLAIYLFRHFAACAIWSSPWLTCQSLAIMLMIVMIMMMMMMMPATIFFFIMNIESLLMTHLLLDLLPADVSKHLISPC